MKPTSLVCFNFVIHDVSSTFVLSYFEVPNCLSEL